MTSTQPSAVDTVESLTAEWNGICDDNVVFAKAMAALTAATARADEAEARLAAVRAALEAARIKTDSGGHGGWRISGKDSIWAAYEIHKYFVPPNPSALKAERDQLAAQCAGMAAALQPFADYAAKLPNLKGGLSVTVTMLKASDEPGMYVTVDDLRRAQSCLANPPAAARSILDRVHQPLFKTGNFTLHSGSAATWKIDCDALTDEDWSTLAAAAVPMLKPFSRVVGVPTGGIKFAQALAKHITHGAHMELIADDVLTTGASMEKERASLPSIYQGVVAFARGPCPDWIAPLFVFGGLDRVKNARTPGTIEICPREDCRDPTDAEGFGAGCWKRECPIRAAAKEADNG